MTMGPDPTIRIFWMSLLFPISWLRLLLAFLDRSRPPFWLCHIPLDVNEVAESSAPVRVDAEIHCFGLGRFRDCDEERFALFRMQIGDPVKASG